MRRHIIVEEHGKVPFPEGFACSELLKSGQADKSRGKLIVFGALAGVIYKICTNVLFIWKETPNWFISFYQNAHLSINCSPALLAAGFIVGPRTAFNLFVGGGFSWWILNPLIQLFGKGGIIVAPADVPISQMTSDDIWFNYIRYIGVGGVGMAGCLSLIRISRVITRAFKRGLDEIFHEAIIPKHLKRTDFDLPMKWLVFGAILLVLILWLYPTFSLNLFMIILFVILGFFFVGLSSLSAGFVGTSSNPTSGMTITFLLIVFMFFILQGWTDQTYIMSALILSIVTSVAIGMAATTAQDLNTGYLLGATPRLQQIGEMIGVILPSIAIAGTIILFGHVYTFGSNVLPAPQATMIAMITHGVIDGGIPWMLLGIGAVMTTLAFLIKLPVMPLALGLYLPISLSSPFIVGGAVAGLVKHYSKTTDPIIRGDVLCSGLVAGDACIGVLIAFLTALGMFKEETSKHVLGDTPSFIIFLILAALVYGLAMKPSRRSKTSPET
jgi:putative OPT family oligopeptide transporter